MKQKINALKCILLASVSVLSLTANAMSIEQQKETVKRIWLIQMVMNNLYTAPAETTFDPETGNITGQSFLSFTQNQFFNLVIDFSNPNAVRASFQHSRGSNDVLDLEFVNGQLVTLHQNTRVVRSEGVFRITQTPNGNYEVTREHRNRQGRNVIEMNGDQIVSVRGYRFNNRNREFHHFTMTFEYNGNEVRTNQVFHTSRDGTRSPIPTTQSRIFEIRSDNNVFKSFNNNSRDYHYNEDGRIVRRIRDNGSGLVQDFSYEYIDDKLSRSIIVTTGTRYEKEIRIYIECPDADRSRPDYEWRQGFYLFNANGILVREMRDGLFRTKTDGVWGEWRRPVSGVR